MLAKLSSINNSTQISEANVQNMEQFVVSFYSLTVNANKVNNARRILFAQGSRTAKSIPPTSDAFKQRIERSARQAIIWRQCSRKLPSAMDPLQWNWQKTELSYSPVRTTLLEASKACRILVTCGCKKSCTARCKCVKNEFNCTELYACMGNCAN